MPRPNSARASMGFRGEFSQAGAPVGRGKHVQARAWADGDFDADHGFAFDGVGRPAH
jgi:hypothetical protein